MRILCDFCGQPLMDTPLQYHDRHTQATTPVSDADAHATTYHKLGRVMVEVRDDLGNMLAYAQHEHPEVT